MEENKTDQPHTENVKFVSDIIYKLFKRNITKPETIEEIKDNIDRIAIKCDDKLSGIYNYEQQDSSIYNMADSMTKDFIRQTYESITDPIEKNIFLINHTFDEIKRVEKEALILISENIWSIIEEYELEWQWDLIKENVEQLIENDQKPSDSKIHTQISRKDFEDFMDNFGIDNP